MINLTGIILFSCISGTVFFIVWFLLTGLLWKYEKPQYTYFTLKMCAIMFFVPFGHVFLLTKAHDNYYVLYGMMTPKLQNTLELTTVIWILGIIVLAGYYTVVIFNYKNIIKSRLVVNIQYIELLEKRKKEMGIKRKIKIYQSYGTQTPFVIGIIRPTIYIPIRNYQEKELEMIFTHELYHFKYHDTVWKPISIFINCLFWFNPAVWMLRSNIESWAEICCDARCCNNGYGVKKYYQSLLQFADVKYCFGFAAAWCEGKNKVIWRLKRMKMYMNKKAKTGIMVCSLAAIILFGGGSVAAATESVSKMYNRIVFETLEGEELENDTYVEETEEYCEEEDFDGYKVIDYEPNIAAYSTTDCYEFVLKTKNVVRTAARSYDSGDTVRVALILSSSDVEVRLGLQRSDGSVRYVTGSDYILHTFTIPTDGTYRIYVQNMGSKSVDASLTVVR